MLDFGGTLGTRLVGFLNWSANTGGATFQNPNSLETAVVFQQANATVSANLKVSQLATSVASNSKPNQQKIVQTANGWLHRTYESMGRVWYEAKPPTGDWQIIGDGAQLSLDGVAAKSPSISTLPSGSGFTGTLASAVMITWQVDNAIKTRIYHPFNGSYTHYLQRTISTDLPLTSEPNPAIAWSGSNEFIIVWASPTGLQFGRYKILTNPDDIGVVATGTIGGIGHDCQIGKQRRILCRLQ
jgi:hypothetical protein